MNRINFLPTWVETNLQPAFYDMESGTCLQQTARMYAKVNQLIRNVNDQNTKIAEYVQKFIELKDYVDDYFDNLDVQEEINNKLDDMAEQGVLADIISQYLNSTAIFAYNSIADMKSSENLIAGSYARTIGYYTANDGGGATYKIREVTNEDVEDDAFIIAMADNNLVAELVIENNTVNIRQLGGKSMASDNVKTDVATCFAKYEAYSSSHMNRIKLYIPSGVWYCSGYQFTHNTGFEIFGDQNFSNSTIAGTILSSYNDNQDYILKFGGNATRCNNCVIKNITFSSFDLTWDGEYYNYTTSKNITSALVLWYSCYDQLDNVFFTYVTGNALNIRSCWECHFGTLNFRQVSSYVDGIITFDTADTSLVAGADCSANDFDYIMFEANHGHLIEGKYQSGLKNTHFGTINFETNHYVLTDEVYKSFNADDISDYDPDTATHFAIFKGGARIVVDSIEMMNLARWYWTHDNATYTYDLVIDPDTNKSGYNGGSLILMNINNIMTEGQLKNADLINNKFYISRESTLNVGSVLNRTEFDLIPNISGGFMINIETPMFGTEAPTGRNTHMSGMFTPFYKTVIRNIGSSVKEGIIYYDADSSNEPKLVVKPYNDTNLNHEQMTFLMGSQTLLVRAKIPNGVSVDLYFRNKDYVSSVTLTETLVGDGSYKNYTIDCSSLGVAGENVSLRLANGQTGKDISLDYFAFV